MLLLKLSMALATSSKFQTATTAELETTTSRLIRQLQTVRPDALADVNAEEMNIPAFSVHMDKTYENQDCGTDAAHIRSGGYRLSDIVRAVPGCCNHIDRFRDTIGFEYYQKKGPEWFDEAQRLISSSRKNHSMKNIDLFDAALLLKIVQQRHHDVKDLPDEKAIVVHLRLGDGINGPNCWNDMNDCYGDAYRYALPQSYYVPMMKKLPPAEKGYHIVLITSNHNTVHRKKRDADNIMKWSHLYLREVWNFFTHYGYPIHVRKGCNADVDITYMSSAHTFIQGGGGFSALAALAVKKKQYGCYSRG
jgi:hypothetical protein